MAWQPVGHLNDVPPLGSRVIETEQGSIAIFRAADERIFAIKNQCPHKQGPLSEGIVHGCKVTCPLHNWVIDLESGDAMPPDQGHSQTFNVKIEQDVLYLDI
jgi:nitrite reductase (NADH) small subunit